MKRKTIISIVTAILAVAIITIVSFVYSGRLQFGNTKEKETVYMSASWNYNYGNLYNISSDSDLIALIEVTTPGDTIVENGLPFTTFTVDVITPVYQASEGESFTIYMTGGETDEQKMEVIDDPLLQVGQEFLVFCKQNTDGTYQILGGPQGRLVYEDGMVSSLNIANERVAEANPYATVLVKNRDVESVIEEIQNYVLN